jgi:hypothetical protein
VADADGTAKYFPKENFSNVCIATVDVIYPSSACTLLFNPALLRAQLQPVLDYARMSRWPWPFAPHDLGTYPARYRKTTHEFAEKWIGLASKADHYKLAFDQAGTWNQKYNLVWDKLLGLNLFPPEVARKEVACSKTRLNAYGLPLDNRKDYTKLDWAVWTATLADSPADFEALVAPAYQFANDSPSPVPLTDWYDTKSGKQQAFQARSVVGGLFIKMLADPVLWKRYAVRAVTAAAPNQNVAVREPSQKSDTIDVKSPREVR